MKMYFLVEGNSTEKKVYPEWLKILIPGIEQHLSYDDFRKSEQGFFLFSGQGYPSILNHISNSVSDINDAGDVNFFFVVLDCDESSVEEREKEVIEKVTSANLNESTECHVIVQKRCFETTLLGNEKVISRQPNTEKMRTYSQYYNVVLNDPEEMGNYSDKFTHSQFHEAYIRAALVEKRVKYSKSNPKEIMSKTYFDELIKRISSTEHLESFNSFVSKISQIKETYMPED